MGDPIDETLFQGYNCGITFNGKIISGQSNSVSITPSVKVDDATHFGTEWRVRVAGMAEWKGNISVFYNEVTDEAFDVLYAAWESGTPTPIVITMDSGTFAGDVIIADVPIKGSPDGGPVMAEVSFEGTGQLTF